VPRAGARGGPGVPYIEIEYASERACSRIGDGLHRQWIALVAVAALSSACSNEPADTIAASTAVVYEGALLIPGDGSAPIAQSAFVVDGGMVTQIGTAADLDVPADAARVDLAGKTVMPALIGAHGHVGYQKGTTFSIENYSRETIYGDLRRAAYFGLGTVMTMGIDTPEFVYDIRDETAGGTAGVPRLRTAGSGIGGPNAGPGNATYARGVAYEVVTEEEGRAAVRDVASNEPDTVKIWLDERGGRGQKMVPEVARAIIDEAEMQGLKVTAHVRGHADAEVAVGAGAYALAHLARDREMDDGLVAAIAERGVYVTPTLSMAERNTYAGTVPPWLQEPYLVGMLNDTVREDVIADLYQSFADRSPEAAENARNNYMFLHNTVTKLNVAGALVILGCDTGLRNHFWGFAEHRELELLVAAGLTPMQAIIAGTSRAAAYLDLDDLGTLAPGKIADFLVLDANPLDDIINTRSISSFYMQGSLVDRAALKAQLTGDVAGTN
jgi:imidazolonepropionase-like amidohydrolase